MLNRVFVFNSYCFCDLGQITQQIFVAEEWYHDARKQADAEALTRADMEKTSGAVKQEQFELTEKLKEANSARSSAEAGLKIVESKLRISARSCT